MSPLRIRYKALETDSVRSATESTDPASLGGAIGGGVGALLLVIVFIWYMMRRISRKEAKEVIEAPRPWVMVPSTPARSPPPPSSSTVSRRAPSSFAEGHRRDRKMPIVINPPTPRSPAGSTISVPTEFYPLSPQYQPTAVASSHIGSVPLPDVPTSPRDAFRDSRTNFSPSATAGTSAAAALGLYSNADSRRSVKDANRSTASLSRPLPLQPGTNQVGTFTYPPEKRELPASERPITKS